MSSSLSSSQVPSSLALINATVVTPDQVLAHGTVGIACGAIVEVKDGRYLTGDYATVVDLRGAYLMPGIIDLHNDSLETEINPRPETNLPVAFALANLERRLLAAGVTSEFHAISFMNNARTSRTIEGAAGRAGFVADYIRSGRQLIDNQVLHRLDVWSPDSLDLLFDSMDRFPVRYVSINDHTPGQGQYRDLSGYKERMRAWSEQRGSALDFSAEAIDRRMKERATDSETVPMVYDRIRAEYEQKPFTIASHDDDSPEKVELLHSLGATISEFPVDAESAGRALELGMHSIVGAPNIVRGGSSSGNQSAAELFSRGLADIICADYHAPSMLPAAFALVDEGILDLPAAVRALSLNPARAVGMRDRGAIAPGYTADLIAVRREGRGFPMVERVLRNGRAVFSLQLPQAMEVPV